MRAAAKSPIEVESRLRTGEVLRSRRCEGPHLAGPCSRARMRPPSPLRSRPDPDRHEIRHAAQGFGQEPTFGRRLLAKAPWGHSDCWETGTPLDVSVTAAVGAGRSVAVGGAALERRSLEWRGTKPASLLQRDSSPTPRSLYATMSSRQPAALTPRSHPKSAAARRRTSHGRDPSRPHTSLSIRALSLFPRNSGMSPLIDLWHQHRGRHGLP